jgi:hypothetical protein
MLERGFEIVPNLIDLCILNGISLYFGISHIFLMVIFFIGDDISTESLKAPQRVSA